MADQATGIFSPWLRNRRIGIATQFITGKVLDYGCGIGTMAKLCDPRNYIGVDIDEGSLDIARTNYPRHRFENGLPDGEQFDTIFLLAVIEHFGDPLTILRDLHARLSSRGQIIITTPKDKADCIHRLGAALGLFSSSAKDEHQQLFNYERMKVLAEEAGLIVSHYESFLLRLNQLFVLKKRSSEYRSYGN